jgi:hypothetical protein
LLSDGCMPLCHSRLVLSAVLGGERQRISLSTVSGYSAKAHCTYLEPNSNRMQKPIGGLSASPAKTIEDRSRIGCHINQKHAEKLNQFKRGLNSIAQQLHNPTHQAAKLYQHEHNNPITEVKVLSESHKMVKKNFETEMWIDGHKMPLNHFVQETIANVMIGFSKTLKGLEASPEKIEVKIKKLGKPADVDAHTYP